MSPRNPLWFGVSVDPTAAGLDTTLELAQLADRAGLELVSDQDHPYHARHLETWTLLSVLAARTERVHVMTNVANLPLRGAQLLAKSAATLSIISGGRVQLGLGAGGFWDAIEAYGGPRRSPGDAVDALIEAIEVMRVLWSDDRRGEVDGRFYRLHGARPGPPPPRPIPIWIGASGPRMLALTGRLADGLTISTPYVPPDRVPDVHRRVDEAAEEAGRDPAEVRRNYNLMGTITDGATNEDPEELAGPPDFWVETLAGWAEDLGFDTFTWWPGGDDPIGQLRRFTDDVVPAVRAAVV